MILPDEATSALDNVTQSIVMDKSCPAAPAKQYASPADIVPQNKSAPFVQSRFYIYGACSERMDISYEHE